MEQQNQQSIQKEENVNRDFQPPKKSFPSRWRLYVVAIIVGGILIPMGIFLLDFIFSHGLLKSSPPAPQLQQITIQNVQQQDTTAGWQTYRNNEFGFEVGYPKDWTISFYNPGRQQGLLPDERSTVFEFIASAEEPSDNYITIFIQPPRMVAASVPWETRLQRCIEGIRGEIMLSGIRGLSFKGKTTEDCSPAGRQAKEVGLISSKGFYFEFYTPKEKEDIFNQILSTFRFVNQDKVQKEKCIETQIGKQQNIRSANVPPIPGANLCISVIDEQDREINEGVIKVSVEHPGESAYYNYQYSVDLNSVLRNGLLGLNPSPSRYSATLKIWVEVPSGKKSDTVLIKSDEYWRAVTKAQSEKRNFVGKHEFRIGVKGESWFVYEGQ